MPPLLTATGRDVIFAHWPVEPEILRSVIPDVLELDTYDGSAWVSVLALENPSVVPGSGRLSGRLQDGFPQLNFRTYVQRDGDSGVYFLSLDSGRWAPAAIGRRGFGLPFYYARMRMTRRGDEITFQSQRETGDTPAAVFQARYSPDGDTYHASEGSLEAFCVEQFRYFLPAREDLRYDPLQIVDTAESGVYLGTIDRKPWELQPATASIRENTLFEAAGLPKPDAEPVVQYSPGFEMAVEIPGLGSGDATKASGSPATD